MKKKKDPKIPERMIKDREKRERIGSSDKNDGEWKSGRPWKEWRLSIRPI